MSSLRVPSRIPLPQEDAQNLNKSLNGQDTSMMTDILAHRNSLQRSSILEAYAARYNKELFQELLDKDFPADFKKALMLWTVDPAERDASLLREATQTLFKNYWVIAEIACTRTGLELFTAKQAYQVRFKSSLEEEVAQHTSGAIQKLMVPVVSTFRYEGDEVKMRVAMSEAKILHEKIEQKAFADDDLIRILTTRSKAQLGATLNYYKTKFGASISKHLNEDSEYIRVLKVVIKCLTSPKKYFAKILRLAVLEMRADLMTLTRVVTTRTEVDMARIKEEFLLKDADTLPRSIAYVTSGDYKDLLLHLIGPDHA